MSIHYSETGTVTSLFKHFQGYLGIFRDTDAYSATHRHTTRGRGESGGRRETKTVLLFWKERS